jgi:hypothetical protein
MQKTSSPNDLITIKLWIVKQLDDLGIKAEPYRAILEGIDEGQDGPQFILDKVVEAYGAQTKPQTFNSQLSRLNRFLLAPACYACGKRDRHWNLSSRKTNPIPLKNFKQAWLDELKTIDHGMTAEAFFEAWLSREETDPTVRINTTVTASTRKQQRQDEEYRRLKGIINGLLGNLYASVAPRKPVLLCGVSFKSVNKKWLKSKKDKYGGLWTSHSDADWHAEFSYDEAKPLPAIQALLAAHGLLREAKRSAKRKSSKPCRLMIFEKRDQHIDIQARLANLGTHAPGKPKNELFLHHRLWNPVGTWANATKRPPIKIPGLGEGRDLWVQLDGLGDDKECFNHSTISDSQDIIGRDKQKAMLDEAWDHVRESSTATIVGVEGESGSGKRSIVDCFVREKLRRKGFRYRIIDFSTDLVDYPYRPYIEMIAHSLGIDLYAESSLRLNLVLRMFQDQGGITKRQAQDILDLFEKLRPNDRRTINLFAASNTSANQQRIHEALKAFAISVIEKQTEDRPLVIIANDVHCGNEPTWELFKALCSHVQEYLKHLPLLVIYTSDPYNNKDTVETGSTDKPPRSIDGAEIIEMEELTDSEMRKLIKSLDGAKIKIDEERVLDFFRKNRNLPGVFIDQLVFGRRNGAVRLDSDAVVARLLRPGDTPNTPSVNTQTIGALALLAAIGGEADTAAMVDIGMRYARLGGIQYRDPAVHAAAMQREIAAHLDRAKLAGIITQIGETHPTRGTTYAFTHLDDGRALQKTLRRLLDESVAQQLAEAMTESSAEADAKLWSAAAVLLSDQRFGVMPHRFWQGAALALLKMGEPKKAARQFYRAYRFAICEFARQKQPESPISDPFYLAFEAYCRHMHTFRLHGRLLKPYMLAKLNHLIHISKRLGKTNRIQFDARLSQWHYFDTNGDHSRAKLAMDLMRKAIDEQDGQVEPQQLLELSYAAWSTSLAQGRLGHAARYFGQLMTLGNLPRSQSDQAFSLSSGHDYKLYVPARHTAAAWLTGDISAVHLFLGTIGGWLNKLPTDEAYRKYWAAAYLIPITLFEQTPSLTMEFLDHVHSAKNANRSRIMQNLASWLDKMARIPEIDDQNILLSLLSIALSDDDNAVGKKHQSVWACLLVRRLLEITTFTQQKNVASKIESAINDCKQRQELFLLAELWRLRAQLYQLDDDTELCRVAIGNAIEIAKEQGAITLEILAIKDRLGLDLDTDADKKNVARRLKHLKSLCDFPEEHVLKSEVSKLVALYAS